MVKSHRSIGNFREFELIHHLTRRFTRGRRFIRGSIGEDAACLNLGRGSRAVITTDLFIEGVHFDRRWMRPEEIGWKLLARGLSDLAACGARPRACFVSAALPRRLPLSFIDGVYRGIGQLARKTGVALMGGDTSHISGKIVFDIVAVGETTQQRYISRRGAKPGDQLCVTDQLGDAALALREIRQGRSRAQVARRMPGPFARLVKPMPRIDQGRLAARRGATAMIDISDGCLADLQHLLEASGVGAVVEWNRVPRSCEDRRLVLAGGDDYELLATFPKNASIPRGFQRIGVITARRGRITLVDANGKSLPLPHFRGYRHF